MAKKDSKRTCEILDPGTKVESSTAVDLPPAPQRSTQPPVGAVVTSPQSKALSPTDHFAAHLSETSGSAYLYCSMAQVFREIGPDAYKTYLTQVLVDAGNPTDPIERMLIEQMCLTHHNVGRLHVKAASAETLEEARIYIGSAALLTGEFRRSVSTLKSYREPSKSSVGGTWMGSATQPGAVAHTGPGDQGETPVSELDSNLPLGANEHDATIVPFAAQPEAGTGWQDEPSEAERIDSQRGRKATRRGTG